MGSKHERVLLHNRNRLEEAKAVGMECEEMAKDIKFNLRSQTDKLENKTLKNLYGMQKDISGSNRLIKLIQKARLKNKLILWGIIALLVMSLVFIIYVSFAPASVPTVVEQPTPQTLDTSSVAEPTTAASLDGMGAANGASVDLSVVDGNGLGDEE